MSIYELDPRPMNGTNLFESIEGAKRCADEQLAQWRTLTEQTSTEDDEDWYILTTELTWVMDRPRRPATGAMTKFASPVDPMFKHFRLTAWYCADYAFTIREREVLP